MKIQTKTGLLFTLITATTLLIVSIAVYYFASRFTYNDFLKRLELRTVMTIKVLFEQNKTSADTYKHLRQQYLEVLPHEKEYIIRTDTLDKAIKALEKEGLHSKVLTSIQAMDGETFYYHNKNTDYAGQLYHHNDGDYIVIKSAVNEYGIETLGHLRSILVVAFIGSALLVYITGIFFSRSTYQPVREINRKARIISASNLGLRIEEQQGTDEVAELAKTFNNMLDRIQTAFETQNNFISNASHEFRTPLTAIIGEADWALAKNRTMHEYQQALSIILRRAEHLQNLTSKLLKLSQSSFDGKKQEWQPIRVDELVNEALLDIAGMDPEKDVTLKIDELPEDEANTLIYGNDTLLQLALVNIISNAIKYSNHGHVEVELIFYDQNARILIKDKGIGIPAEEIKRVFEPFFRGSNTGPFEGYGVGLPLSMNIMRLHHGTIEVYSAEKQGTTVVITLPLYRQAASF